MPGGREDDFVALQDQDMSIFNLSLHRRRFREGTVWRHFGGLMLFLSDDMKRSTVDRLKTSTPSYNQHSPSFSNGI